MKALTICQPYAHLIASGEKSIENRTWSTSYRGPLLIHAGKSRAWLDEDDEEHYPTMVYGAFVARATLVDCKRVEDLTPEQQRGEHANGPWCWMLEDVQSLPVPLLYRGAQGLWDAPDTIWQTRTESTGVHVWTPDATKNRCIICGDGPWGRHRFQEAR